MSKRVEDIQFVDQRALTLVIDIAVLLEESEKNKGAWLGSAFARSAITNAALLLECVSNSCLGSLALPTRLLEELDRLPALSKLDYYLFSRTSKHLDRGFRETELAGDVLKLRDHIVHPKLKPGSIAGVGEEQYVDYGAKALGIALDNREWTHQDGIKVAEAATAFLRLYFLDWCGHNKGNATRVLVCRERDILQQRELPMWMQMPRAERDLIQKWLPATLSFMDLRLSERET